MKGRHSYQLPERDKERHREMVCDSLGFLPEDRKCKYKGKERASLLLLSQHFSAVLAADHSPKAMIGRIRSANSHSEFGAYQYFQSTWRPRHIEFKKQAPVQYQGHCGITVHRILLEYSFPPFNIAACIVWGADWEQI